MSTPKPANFTELSDAWNDPIEFGKQLAIYYADLKRAGVIEQRDITEPERSSW